jgi:hypothetical protein
MKNIHILPTDKPSRLAGSEYITNVQGIDKRVFKFKLWNKFIDNKDLKAVGYIPHNIYITNDEEIKQGDWIYRRKDGYETIQKATLPLNLTSVNKKIILTTDQDLIKDGVQAIDDDVLEWFVKNPSCEEVEVKEPLIVNVTDFGYKIIIPKEEPKQETLEDITLEEVFGSAYCHFSVVENKLAILYRNQEQLLKAIKLLSNEKRNT